MVLNWLIFIKALAKGILTRKCRLWIWTESFCRLQETMAESDSSNP